MADKEDRTFNETELPFVAKAEHYCALSEQCRASVRDKLYGWGANRDLTERIIEHLVYNDFLNESRYCRLYCDSKLHLQKWGRVKISYQLRLKHINNAIIEEALKNIDEDQYTSTLDQLATSKLRTINEPDPHKREAKLISYLNSHGFEFQEIQKSLEKMRNI